MGARLEILEVFMRARPRLWLSLFALAVPAAAQIATPRPPGATPHPKPPLTVEGYVATVEVKALAPELKRSRKAAPEAQVVIQQLKETTRLASRFSLAKDFSRQEVLSTDFVLPAGTLLLHKGGDRFYVIADPKAKTYHVMDSEQLLNALEGGAGILNTEYQAKVTHSPEKKDILGFRCRKSTVTVTYASSIPFENDRVIVQQNNDIEVWHTADLVSNVVMDHFFFRFQKDKTGTVKRVLEAELGFPMEVSFVVTQAGAKKQTAPQPGSFQMRVTELRKEPKLEGTLFQIPPDGYRKLERSPYFAK
jgi:hypothetical protein